MSGSFFAVLDFFERFVGDLFYQRFVVVWCADMYARVQPAGKGRDLQTKVSVATCMYVPRRLTLNSTRNRTVVTLAVGGRSFLEKSLSWVRARSSVALLESCNTLPCTCRKFDQNRRIAGTKLTKTRGRCCGVEHDGWSKGRGKARQELSLFRGSLRKQRTAAGASGREEKRWIVQRTNFVSVLRQ